MNFLKLSKGRWLGKYRLVRRNASFKPCPNSPYAHATNATPLRDYFSLLDSVNNNCQKSIVAFIGRLLESISPTTILWFVITPVVNPVNRVVAWWPMSHIFKKVLKTLPTLANLNTLLAILIITRVRWSLATSFHSRPSPIGGGLSKLMGFHNTIIINQNNG